MGTVTGQSRDESYTEHSNGASRMPTTKQQDSWAGLGISGKAVKVITG